MKILKKKTLLNLMITLSLIVLGTTTFLILKRNEAQSDFEALAALRNDETSYRSTYQASNVKVPIIEEKEEKYPYIANENSKWLDINKDFFGWIRIDGTQIDYPFVRSHDNKEYLNLDFYGNVSELGTLFLDYRNLGNFNDQHTIIYGHYTLNGTMFHNLTLYHKNDYLLDHPTIEVAGLYETKTYTIFSVYEISADDYTFTLNFNEGTPYEQYLESLISASLHPVNFDINKDSKLLTLVTCSYGVYNGRTIVHAIEN